MGSGEEVGPFLTHYFFRPLYLSIAIIRPFDRALLLISGDIEENPGPVSIDGYKKTPTTLSPSPSTSSSSYHSMDESTPPSARSSRSRMSSNESSPGFKLPSTDSTRHSPYQLRSARQLKYQAPVDSHPCDTILTTTSFRGSAGTNTESTQDRCLSQLQNQAQCQIPNSDPTHSKDKSAFSCHLSQLRLTERPSLPLKWSKAKTDNLQDRRLSQSRKSDRRLYPLKWSSM